MDENFLTVVDENGNEILCEIIFTFDSEDYKKSYVLYTPVETKDDDEEVEVLCSSFVPSKDGAIGQLMPIESDEEWEMVEEIFNTYLSNMDDEDFDDEEEDDHECGCGHHHHGDKDHDCECDHDHEDHECECGHKEK
ncbi:MAG: YrzB [Haloplasmataceae bacterium]|jgi:uncharacterized protein YrzB (UPF0473 family)|nr:YrzB [Haloplasmataceae bacterium]